MALLAVQDESRFYNTFGSPASSSASRTSSRADAARSSSHNSDRDFHVQNCIEAATGAVAGASSQGRYSVWSRCGTAHSMTVTYTTANDKGYGHLPDRAGAHR